MKNTILLCSALAAFFFNAHAADFPQAKSNNWHHWRGPEANGISPTAKPPTKWSEKKNVRWKAPIDGFGTSTPIIWGNKVFLLTAINTGKVDPSLPRPEDQPKRVFDITHPNTTYAGQGWVGWVDFLGNDRDEGEECAICLEPLSRTVKRGRTRVASASP